MKLPISRIVTVALAVALSSLASTAPVQAAKPRLGAAEVLAGIQRWLDGTEDLQGRFSQRMESGAFGESEEESGRLFVERPGRMRWEYDQPESKLALIDGPRTWFYVESENELYLGLLDETTELLPLLLAGAGRLDGLFAPFLEEPTTEDGDDGYRLRLRPLDSEGEFEEILVSTHAPGFAIESAQVLDAAGNRVFYGFTKLRRNRGLPADLFRFVPGPGVRVSGSHEP